MKNGNFKKIFLTVGGAAAGANVASIVVGSIISTVPVLVPVVGAIFAAGFGLAAANSDDPVVRKSAGTSP